MPGKSRIDLSDGVIVVTGGGRGIGAAAAQAFSARGARVWIGDIDTDIARATATSIPRCRSARLDVTDVESWRTFITEVIAEEGRIDILVNNAGVMPLGGFVEESESTIDLILDVNVRGVINGMRAVLPGMVEAGRGHIVNVASMAGMIPIPGMVTYNGSKFAALGLSLAARHEYAGTGVTVTAVLPSAVRTELSSGARLGNGMPTVDPEDVARAVVDSVRRRTDRVSVPGWVAPGWSLVQALVPRFIENALRRLVDDRRALNGIDPDGRRAYFDRIERHAREHNAAAEPAPKRSRDRKADFR